MQTRTAVMITLAFVIIIVGFTLLTADVSGFFSHLTELDHGGGY